MGQRAILLNRFPHVHTVLVVLSAAGLVLDIPSFSQQILFAYPKASVYFVATNGKQLETEGLEETAGYERPEVPLEVDLVIDLTGPHQRQSWFFAKKLRQRAKFIVGRDAGFFRKKIYDRVFDEKSEPFELSSGSFDELSEQLIREREIQKKVLALAGVPWVPSGCATPDLAETIALELPPLRHAA